MVNMISRIIQAGPRAARSFHSVTDFRLSYKAIGEGDHLLNNVQDAVSGGISTVFMPTSDLHLLKELWKSDILKTFNPSLILPGDAGIQACLKNLGKGAVLSSLDMTPFDASKVLGNDYSVISSVESLQEAKLMIKNGASKLLLDPKKWNKEDLNELSKRNSSLIISGINDPKQIGEYIYLSKQILVSGIDMTEMKAREFSREHYRNHNPTTEYARKIEAEKAALANQEMLTR